MVFLGFVSISIMIEIETFSKNLELQLWLNLVEYIHIEKKIRFRFTF